MKRSLAIILTIAMCLSLMPLAALADETSYAEEPDYEATEAMQPEESSYEEKTPAEEQPTAAESSYIEEATAEEVPSIQDEPAVEEDEDPGVEDGAVSAEEDAPAPEEPVATKEDPAPVEISEAEFGLDVESDDEITAIETKVEEITLGGDDNDELFAGYVDQVFGIEGVDTLQPVVASGKKSVRSASSAGSRLTGLNKVIYDCLAAHILAIAAGGETSTEFALSMAELGIDVLTGTGATSDDASASLTSAFEKKYPDEIAMSAVLNALLADYPYEMFWYDKTTSTSTRGPGSGASGNSSGWTARYSSGITISMPVASEYAVSTYEVDGDKITVVQSAADNAQAVVAGHAFDTDKAKLTAYRDYICDQTSYNDDAANKSTNTPYGNPWQLIWVFDNDSDTTVVCEGYAKAFKYLCDLSTFTSDKIDCILVSGVMTGGTGAGGHMWNIVTLDDGRHYLVDVTNCDEGTIGYPEKLFLAGYDSKETGFAAQHYDSNNQLVDYNTTQYTFNTNNTKSSGVSYYYSYDTEQLYTDDQLKLAITKEHTHSWDVEWHWTAVVDEDEMIVGYSGVTATFTCAGCDETQVLDAEYSTNDLGEGDIEYIATVERDGELYTSPAKYAHKHSYGPGSEVLPLSYEPEAGDTIPLDLSCEYCMSTRKAVEFTVDDIEVIYPVTCDPEGELGELSLIMTAEGYDPVTIRALVFLEHETGIDNNESWMIPHAKQDATCTEYGYSEDCWECKYCGQFWVVGDEGYEAAENIEDIRRDPLGHDWVTNDGVHYTCTRCGETKTGEPTETPSNIVSNSVNFEGKLGLYFYVHISDELLADPDSYAVITTNGVDKTVLISDAPVSTKNGITRRQFSQDVVAKQMRDEITLRLYDGSGNLMPLLDKTGNDVTETGYTYSVMAYLGEIQEKSSNEYMVALAVATENYGTAAQVRFGYSASGLSIAPEVTAVTLSDLAEFAPVYTGTLPGGIISNTSSIQFDEDNTVRQYFTLEAGRDINAYTFTLDGAVVTPVSSGTNKYYVALPNIAAKDLDIVHQYSVTDGTDTYSFSFSPLSYAYKIIDGSTQENMINLAKALFLYNQAANEYFAHKS